MNKGLRCKIDCRELEETERALFLKHMRSVASHSGAYDIKQYEKGGWFDCEVPSKTCAHFIALMASQTKGATIYLFKDANSPKHIGGPERGRVYPPAPRGAFPGESLIDIVARVGWRVTETPDRGWDTMGS